MMKGFLLTLGSVGLSASVVANAYYQKKQFYPSVVYITKSNPSMAVLYLQAFVFVILMGKLIRKIFFGQLRAAEMEHLIERSWYAVTETCLAFTVFRDDFSPRFVALFTLLLFLKCFHWLAEDRVDYMERSPVISLLFHLRAIALLTLLGTVDIYFINHAYYSTLIKGASVQLVFGFEYAILLTMVMTVLVKYFLHTIDLQSENPWENKAVYMLYTDLVLGFIKVVLYVLFLAIMIKVHTFPLFAIRPMYLTMRAFKKALNDVIMSRRAIRNMNTLYPDASEEDLASGDNVCIICREDMTTSCKKLPCSHIFHTNCLRSWFQRQQTCPTCRMDVLRQTQPRQTTPQQQPQQQQPQAQQPGFPGAPPGAFPGPYGMWLPPGAAAAAQAAQAGAAGAARAPQTSVPGSTIPGAMPTAGAAAAAGAMPPFMMMPPFPFMPPFGMPPPVPPVDLRGLTEDELRRMEGVEQRHLAARVQWLRDIHATLDAAMLQIQQYTQMCNSMGLHTGFTIPQPTDTAADVKSQPPKTSKSSTPSTSASSTKPSSSKPGLTPNSSSSQLGAAAESSTAKPKQSSQSAEKKDEKIDYADLEGAVGYSAPKEEFIPEWNDPRTEEETDEVREMRRRRLARFSSESSDQGRSEKDNLDLD